MEIGCGTGGSLKKISKITKNKVFGVDISPASIKDIADMNIEAKLFDMDKESLPYESNTFDVVFSSHTIEHIIDTHKFMEESRRVLKDGGRLIICCPNINTPISWFMQIFLDLTPKAGCRPYSSHYRDFSLKILSKAFKMHGFEIVTRKSIGIFPFNNFITNGILYMFPRFGESIIIEGVKKERQTIPEKIYEDIRSL
jgi:ubiquinone/menaquinone biosynthesis C-methylase UbiE